MNHTLTDRFLLAFALTATVIALAYMFSHSDKAYGSVAVSNEYQATSTSPAQATASPVRLMRTGVGSLGSVVVVGKNTGLVQIYDATTTDVSKRTNNIASTSLILVDLPTNAPEGTYTFDLQYTNGLIIVDSGSAPTTTVTWR